MNLSEEKALHDFLSLLKNKTSSFLRKQLVDTKNDSPLVWLTDATKLRLKLSSENPLTLREMTCLILLAMGKSPPQCADLLGISVRSVTTYEERIRKKLGARNRTHAFYLASIRGYFSFEN